MKILIDIVHASNVVFFKESVLRLQKDHEVTLICRQRGKLLEFARGEFPCAVRHLGNHHKSIAGKIIFLFLRTGTLVYELLKNRYDVVTSHSGFYVAIAAWLTRTKSVLFCDNFEYRTEFKLCELFSDRVVIPEVIGHTGANIVHYRGYKELAYLYDFEPDDSVLVEYGVEPGLYVFIRHIAHVSLDYRKHDHEALLSEAVDYLNGNNIPIIASIETGSDHVASLLKTGRVIRKPTSKMHSLIYYSRCVLSSGDTVAREAALLGIPSLYIGSRRMRINDDLIRKGLIHQPEKTELIGVLKRLLNRERTSQPHTLYGWEDTTRVILSHLSGL